MKRVVITINRQYGSGGKTIGYMLAEKLGIPCYSREILQRASEESGINESMFNARDERLKRLPKFLLSTNVYSGELLPPESKEFTSDQNLFNYEAEIIKKYAAEGSCVLIGRCADFVLKDDPDMISVYVHADHDFQMKSALDFYHYHTGRSWDDAENYDLCINSGKLGFEKTVELIESYINIK